MITSRAKTRAATVSQRLIFFIYRGGKLGRLLLPFIAALRKLFSLVLLVQIVIYN